ncbi:cathepsin O-like [Epargyreus clarus]|uniref:cathepsin O-like n=1 Tax=Epargyreus clarus TaxID=520877 RepID=UPI003C3072CF
MMMKKWWTWLLLIALVCLLFIFTSMRYTGPPTKEELRPMFDEYIKKFNKTYKDDPVEYESRLTHFVASVQEIEALNAASRGPESNRAQYGLTKLSDMSKGEYKDLHLSDEMPAKRTHGHRHSRKEDSPQIKTIDDSANNDPQYNVYNVIRKRRATLPLSVDWRTKGVIGPVHDQGICGACWAFSTVGTMEAMASIATGKLQSLSVQEAIDCAGLGNSGCGGGDICLLLDWLKLTNTALETEKEYPLRLMNGACSLKKNATGVRVSTFTCDDFVGAEERILQALATHGPVTVAVNALTWQNYLGGVIQYHCSGAPTDLNHAVELVGYDITGEVPYYIAKNSWGSEFGINGYINLAVGQNMCGLANEVASIDVTLS